MYSTADSLKGRRDKMGTRDVTASRNRERERGQREVVISPKGWNDGA
jgi:hypothetical protein